MKKFSLLFRKWHKWLALIVGVQLFLWTFSGLYMSAVPIENIRSEHRIKKVDEKPLSISENLYPIEKLLEDSGQGALSLKLKMFLGKSVYEIEWLDKSKDLFDSESGKKLSPVSEATAREVARKYYSGSETIKAITLVKKEVSEYRGKYPVWRVDFDNVEDTSFYIARENGKLTAKRGLLWRIYDFLWMLHIMDYKERENFNNWWLVFAAGLATLVSITGLMLIKSSFRKRDFIKIFKLGG